MRRTVARAIAPAATPTPSRAVHTGSGTPVPCPIAAAVRVTAPNPPKTRARTPATNARIAGGPLPRSTTSTSGPLSAITRPPTSRRMRGSAEDMTQSLPRFPRYRRPAGPGRLREASGPVPSWPGKADHHGFCRYGLAAARVVRNGLGSLIDMADMRQLTARVSAALVLAAAGVAVTGATAGADPAAPAGAHQVRYTLVRRDGELRPLLPGGPAAEQGGLRRRRILLPEEGERHGRPGSALGVRDVARRPELGHPDREQHHARWPGRPNPHCEIAVDGQVAVQQDAPYNLQCQLKQW